MLEYEILLTASAAMLVVASFYQQAGLRRGLGNLALISMFAGTLVPLLDLPLRYIQAADRIALLSGDGLFYGLYPASLVIVAAALLCAAIGGRRMVIVPAAGLFIGYFLHIGFAIFTPAGAAIMTPFSNVRISFPVLPTGHLAINGVLLVALIASGLFSRARTGIYLTAAIALAGYAVFAVGQWSMISLQAQKFEPQASVAHVYPVNALMTEWAIVKEDQGKYHHWQWHTFENTVTHNGVVPRTSDPGALAWLMADTTVQGLYYRMFRFPVAKVDVSNSQISLVVQELADLHRAAGRTLNVAVDRAGGGRFYELLHFY